MRLKNGTATGNGMGRRALSASLGFVRDTISVGQQGVRLGFGFARLVTNAWFGLATAWIGATTRAAEWNALHKAVLYNANDIVGLAHQLTIAGQDAAHSLARVPLSLSDYLLGAAGGQRGQMLRLALGDEGVELFTAVSGLLQNLTEPLASGCTLPQMYTAAAAWSALQHAAAEVGEQSRSARRETVHLPEHSARWFRFTAATMGTLWCAGFVEGFSFRGVRTQRARVNERQGAGPGEASLACAGIDGRVEVVTFEERTNEWFAPGYLVAVDHDRGVVVVAIRATASISDTITDLMGSPLPVKLGGYDGLTHEGMWRAAQRLQGDLSEWVQVGIDKLGHGRARRVILTGHSLGAGVASLVVALWHASGRFAGENVECLAFGPPQVLDAGLAQAQSNHTHSFVVGDDMFPRSGLATAQDFRNAVLLLNDPAAGGLESPENFSAQALLDLETRGEHRILAERYAYVRPKVRTSQGRLYPSGRVLLVLPGQAPYLGGLEDVDELRISRDMFTTHMPHRYVLALQDAEAAFPRAGAKVHSVITGSA